MLAPIKKVVAYLGFRLNLWNLGFLLFRIKVSKPMLIVFTFHRVTDSKRSNAYYMYYERGMDCRVFDEQLKAINHYFDIVSLDEFIDILQGRRMPKRNSALITFDDADSEFVDYALPLLCERGIPSVMFTPTDFVDAANRFWHLRVSNIVRKLGPEHWTKFQHRAEELPARIREIVSRQFPSNETGKRNLALDLNHGFDKENIKHVMRIIDGWESIIGGEFVLGIGCMNWEQLRDLDRNNVAIESHSHSHGKLAQCEPAELRDELTCSKGKIESELGKSVKAISYPGGSYDERVVKTAQEAGYIIGFTTENGHCKYPMQGPELFKLPRYSLYGDTRDEIHYVLGTLAVKGMFGWRL